jgi:hypothetical protein
MVTSLRLAAHMAAALGLSGQTVVQHVKNLQQEKLLTSTGRGRGAAHMKPSDVAKLLIATAGSIKVKDSVLALRAFGSLVPISETPTPRTGITLMDHLAALLTAMASEANAEMDTKSSDMPSNLCLTLLSVAGTEWERFPCVAIARRIRRGRYGVGSISFATATWQQPKISVANYAVQMKGSGLIVQKHVTFEAMAKIASCI